MRYFDITQFKVKPGHMREWEELVKIYKEGFEKGVPGSNWAVFESMYGQDNGGYFLVFQPMKTLAEVDQDMGAGKKFAETIGEDGMKRVEALTASCLESSQSNLFVFRPKMSYPMEEWVKADPDFWRPKAAPVKKAAPAE